MGRKTYTVPSDDVKYLKECASLPFMKIGRRDPWDLIQARWEMLARTMGFDLDTVEIVGLGPTFTAVPPDRGS
jgi:histone acetyltransferase (RNA polymerase elongator complex component)